MSTSVILALKLNCGDCIWNLTWLWELVCASFYRSFHRRHRYMWQPQSRPYWRSNLLCAVCTLCTKVVFNALKKMFQSVTEYFLDDYKSLSHKCQGKSQALQCYRFQTDVHHGALLVLEFFRRNTQLLESTC